MPPKRNATPVKHLEGSTMLHEESQDMSLRMSQLEQSFNEMMKKLEENMEIIANLLQQTKENIPNGDNVVQGTHDYRNSSHCEQPSFSKHTPGGFDSNTRINQGWFPRGIQLPKIDMRKFYRKYHITWIFQMEQLFDLHQVPDLQKVTIASLYLEHEQFVWYQRLCEHKKYSIISWSILIEELISCHDDKNNTFY